MHTDQLIGTLARHAGPAPRIAGWRAMGLPIHRIAVNVSPRQLKAAGFADMVLDLSYLQGGQ